MRPTSHHHGAHAAPGADKPAGLVRGDWRVVRDLLPYLLEHKVRVLLALSCLIAAKFANLGIPILLKDLIDTLNTKVDATQALVLVPVGLILAYGALRVSASLFNELREALFARVTQNAVRKVALQVFNHLHSLALSFHLARQTGGVSRDIERGTRGIQSLISYSLYSILPTLIEFCLVLGYLAYAYDIWFAVITFVALVLYIIFTVVVTEWRTHFRRTMNDMDSRANQKAIDSLLNFETVKYFGNEEFESRRYDENLVRYQAAAIQSQKSLAVLNLGQQIIIAIGLVLILWRATIGVSNGTMTLGDLVLVNTLMIQLYIPLNFLGVIYREIKQAITDMDRMFTLLGTDREVADKPNAPPLHISHYETGPEVRFEHVSFHYEKNAQFCAILRSRFLLEPLQLLLGRAGLEKVPWRVCCFVFTIFRRAELRWMGRILTLSSKAVCVGLLVLFRKIPCYLMTRLDITLPMASRAHPWKKSRKQLVLHKLMGLFSACQMAITLRWASVA